MRPQSPSAEYDLIKELATLVPMVSDLHYEQGIGNDAAVRRGGGKQRTIITTDTCVEGVHFNFKWATPAQAGYKAMVTNLSDCASMGAKPESCFVNLVFPAANPRYRTIVRNLYKGIGSACRTWGCSVAGGDLSGGPCFMLAITLLGTLEPRQRALCRTGIAPGDVLWASGIPGRSAAGLALLERQGSKKGLGTGFEKLIRAHLCPVPFVELGQELSRDRRVHACMDLSDGLSKDAATLCAENGLDLVLNPPDPKVARALGPASQKLGIEWEKWYYHGGEDYILLYTASADYTPPASRGLALRLGTFSKGSGSIFLAGQNGAPGAILGRGAWDHAT